jgi:Nodulation protein Z (NodZ)
MAYFPRLQVPRRILNEFRLSKRANALAVEVHADVGFFAQLNWCLYILAYCEQQNLIPEIRLTGAQYGETRNQDWFHDFFEEKGIAKAPRSRIHASSLYIRHIQETGFASRYAPLMTIEWAHRLFNTYYSIKPAIASYVDDFVSREFSGSNVLGVHYRGTDKKTEAEPVDWKCCFQSVMKLASDHPEAKKVFLSSDDPTFIDWFAKEAKSTLRVIFHPDEERSRDAQPIHLNPSGNAHRKGFEALVNCLLLSRCTALIRTASFLSGWSSVFNPLLPITLLNEPFAHVRWFPDRELILRSDNRYR